MKLVAVGKVKALLLIASQISGYPIPDAPLPPVWVVSSQEMAREACPEDSFITCHVIGFFEFPHDGKVERVLVEGDVDEHSPDAILVHELTHWLQYHNWKYPDQRICPRELLREYQAYMAGYTYEVVVEHKQPPEAIELPGVECPFSLTQVSGS